MLYFNTNVGATLVCRKGRVTKSTFVQHRGGRSVQMRLFSVSRASLDGGQIPIGEGIPGS